MSDNYRRTKQQVVELMDNILKHIVSGKTDKQIIDLLKVERAQYYKYKSKLLAESIEASIKRTEENKLIEEMLLKQRLLDLHQRALTKISEAEPKDAATLIAEARTTAVYILRLENEGLKFLDDLRKGINKDVAKRLGIFANESTTDRTFPIDGNERATTAETESEEFKRQAVF